jgi:uncharacterized protein (TIGR00369 family)
MTLDLDARLAFAGRWTEQSPYYAAMGISVVSLEEGRANLRLEAAEIHLNADGIVHGGVLPALADAAMGCALRTLRGAGAQILTIESNIRYLRPAGRGALVAEGRVVHAGASIAFMEVEVSDGQGLAVARGGGTFAVRRKETA